MKLRLLFHLQICVSHRRLYPINDVPGNLCFTSRAEGCTKGILPVGFRCRSVLKCAERLRSEDCVLGDTTFPELGGVGFHTNLDYVKYKADPGAILCHPGLFLNSAFLVKVR